MKKVFAFLASLALPAVMLAQESSGTVDLSAAGTAASSIGTAIAGLLTGAVLTALIAVVGGKVVIRVVKALPGWLMGGR